MLTADVMSGPWLTHFRATQATPFSAESVFPDFFPPGEIRPFIADIDHAWRRTFTSP